MSKCDPFLQLFFDYYLYYYSLIHIVFEGNAAEKDKYVLFVFLYSGRAAFAYSQNHYTNCIKTHSSVQFFSDGVTVVLKISIVYKRFCLNRSPETLANTHFFNLTLLHKRHKKCFIDPPPYGTNFISILQSLFFNSKSNAPFKIEITFTIYH